MTFLYIAQYWIIRFFLDFFSFFLFFSVCLYSFCFIFLLFIFFIVFLFFFLFQKYRGPLFFSCDMQLCNSTFPSVSLWVSGWVCEFVSLWVSLWVCYAEMSQKTDFCYKNIIRNAKLRKLTSVDFFKKKINNNNSFFIYFFYSSSSSFSNGSFLSLAFLIMFL